MVNWAFLVNRAVLSDSRYQCIATKVDGESYDLNRGWEVGNGYDGDDGRS